MKIPELEKRSVDHSFNCVIKVNDTSINDVECRLYLPTKIYEKPYVLLTLPEKIQYEFRYAWEVSVYAMTLSFIGKPELELNISNAYVLCQNSKYIGNKLRTTVLLEPTSLDLTKHYGDDTEKEKISEIIFNITKNKQLTPAYIEHHIYNGNIEIDKISTIEYLLDSSSKLSFDKRYTFKNEHENLIRNSYLSASYSSLNYFDNNEVSLAILEKIDDILIIASYASRCRTTCPSWDIFTNKIHKRSFRCDLTHPSHEPSDIDNAVIPIEYYSDFVSFAYGFMNKATNKESIKHAIYSLTAHNNTSLEQSFFKLFSGLENIILQFRRENNLEFILDIPDWKSLKKELERTIKNTTSPIIEKNSRVSLYNKLNEINRVSLKEAYEELINKYNIDVSYLWPLFKDKSTFGLADIRNALIHGEIFPHTLIDALIVAKEHLALLIETILLGILGWQKEKSLLNERFLKTNYTSMRDINEAQQSFNQFWQIS